MKYGHYAILALFSLAGITRSMAAPIYVGLQSGNGAIAQPSLATVPSGGYSFSLTEIGTSGVYASGSVEGTPPLPEPELLSNTLEMAGEGDPSGAVVSIYVTETNQFPASFNSYFSHFSTTLPAIVNSGPNSVTQVEESIYVHDCTGSPGCNATTDVFNLDKLVASDTFTATGSVSDVNQITPGLTGPYAITEVYTVTFGPGGLGHYGEAINSISMSVPEPASLAILGVSIIGMTLVRRRRRASP